jgi:hypothetical protein
MTPLSQKVVVHEKNTTRNEGAPEKQANELASHPSGCQLRFHGLVCGRWTLRHRCGRQKYINQDWKWVQFAGQLRCNLDITVDSWWKKCPLCWPIGTIGHWPGTAKATFWRRSSKLVALILMFSSLSHVERLQACHDFISFERYEVLSFNTHMKLDIGRVHLDVFTHQAWLQILPDFLLVSSSQVLKIANWTNLLACLSNRYTTPLPNKLITKI